MYTFGVSTGVIVDIGHATTVIMPIYQGFGISNACKRIELGGQDITDYLTRLLCARNLNRCFENMDRSSLRLLIEQIKEKYLKVKT
jgi:actin-related protein